MSGEFERRLDNDEDAMPAAHQEPSQDEMEASRSRLSASDADHDTATRLRIVDHLMMTAPLVRDLDQVRRNVDIGREQVLDARGAGRFAGTEPEPRAGLRGGHIPGSLNLPYGDLLDSETAVMLPARALKARFEAAGVDFSRPVVTTCGSGVTAGILALGLHLLGHRDVALYDGSWTEWGGREDTPIHTGAP